MQLLREKMRTFWSSEMVEEERDDGIRTGALLTTAGE